MAAMPLHSVISQMQFNAAFSCSLACALLCQCDLYACANAGIKHGTVIPLPCIPQTVTARLSIDPLPPTANADYINDAVWAVRVELS